MRYHDLLFLSGFLMTFAAGYSFHDDKLTGCIRLGMAILVFGCWFSRPSERNLNNKVVPLLRIDKRGNTYWNR